MQTFFWHDYETWGINPALDMPSQFAGVRTDWELNIIDEPVNVLCKPPQDCLPTIEAAFVTGLTPQDAERDGLTERDFFAAVHAQLARANTCGVGYNSIRFDDEVTRYGFYRNFYDPYAREWQSGGSRWDIVDLVRLCYAVRPEGIEWPFRETDQGERVPSLRLELISQLNGIEHESAHDALSDVYATIAVAKLIRRQQPKMYEHVLSTRDKKSVLDALALGSGKPRLHISSMFGANNASASLILPVMVDPRNRNEVHCIDLRYSPSVLMEYEADDLAKMRFLPAEELPDSVERFPLKSVHLNKCPVVLPPAMVDDAVAARCNIDVQRCEEHRKMLLAYPDLQEKLLQVLALANQKPFDAAAEAQLYAGFIGNQDRGTCQQVLAMDGKTLAAKNLVFDDPRLTELLFRYRARNFPAHLSSSEQEEWQEWIGDRIQQNNGFVEQQLGLARECLAAEVDQSSERHRIATAFLKFYEKLLSQHGQAR